VPAFGTEGTEGCTSSTKVREGQRHCAPAENIASGASGGTDGMSGKVLKDRYGEPERGE
jgi:hypothetical protein